MIEVTTLIPVYNGARYIAEAVASALDQQGVNNEVIVIDDGSTDETPDILKRFGDSIRVLQQKNAGHVKARNAGARHARGEWLAFLDADDAWLPGKLRKQLEAAGSTAGMVYTDRCNFGETNRVKAIASHAVDLHEGDLFEPLLMGNFVTVASAIMRREWFERLGGFAEDLLVCEDWDLWLRFSLAGGIAKVCREPLTRYRWHAASMTNNQTRMCAGRLKVLDRALHSTRGQGLPKATVRRARASVWRCSAWYAAPTQRWTALHWYIRSALHWPMNVDVYRQAVKCCIGRA